MVEEQKTPNPEHLDDAPKPALGEIGASIRAQILEACKAHPLWEQLQARKKSGEIDREDFGYWDVRELFEVNTPVQRKHIGNRALVLSATDVEQFHVFNFVDQDGVEQQLFSEDVNGVLILFPEDFGNPS